MVLRLAYTVATAVVAVLTVVATFLAWASLDVKAPALGTISSANQYGYESDGIVTLFLGIVTLGVGFYPWLERRPSTFLTSALFGLFLGGVLFAIALVNLFDTERAVGAAQSRLGLDAIAPFISLTGFTLEDFIEARTGAGVYTALVAGVLLALASGAAYLAARVEPFASALAADAGLLACKRCGGELPARANYCPACGTKNG